MARKSPVELLIGTIRSPRSGADVFINEMPLVIHEDLYASFGGGLLGQSVTAAAATVPPAFVVYSVQSAFLRPARRDGEIAYHVDCTAYGRTYATRTVRATQGAHDDTSCIYVGILSFQRCDLPPGNHLKYSIPMPHIGDSIRPESIPRARAQQRAMMAISARGDGTSPPLDGGDGDTAFDWRPLEGPPPPPPADEDERAQSRQQRAFVRSAPLSSDSASAHLAALACLSDTYALGAALGHGANPATLGPKIREEVAMGVSLNHNVSLHDPTARADEWLLCERDASWGADGRVLVHQRFWSAGTGRLVVSGMQEGLIRLKPGSSL